MRKRFFFIALLVFAPQLLASQVVGVRLWTAPDHTRLVFDTTEPTEHKVFSLKKPDRLVIDFSSTTLSKSFATPKIADRHLSGMRQAPRDDGSLRVVLDLKQPVRPKTFLLKPNSSYGHRLVVDLYPVEATRKPRVAKSTKDIGKLRDLVIAVDAGHGGDDPGASGSRHRTKEKRVTLEIARRVKRLIDQQPGMRAVLTRTGDYYVGLRKRMKLARKHRADLFLSIHADAFKDKRVRGSSVYVLSERGASSEAARWLAAKENSADLVGGVSLDDKEDLLKTVLLDLSQSATQHASFGVANKVYRQLRHVGKTHGKKVQRANFLVLKSPDIPSMLVETGFISNPDEESNLRDAGYQERMARAIMAGVKQYFSESPPPGTVLARQQKKTQKHVIVRGDTLSEIADRYQVTVARLCRENRIRRDNHIRIGQVLVIPDT